MTSVRAGWLLLLLMAAGCSGAKGPAFRPEVVEPTKAVVYIYRVPRSWAGSPVAVSLDQASLGHLEAGQYLARLVEPGRRLVRVVGGSDAVKQFTLGAGDSAFIEVRSSYWDGRPEIELLDEQEALPRITQTGRAEAAR